MTVVRLPPVQTETEYFAFAGGLDQTTPAIKVPPGRLFSCQNYEPDIDGGYRRVRGYERFDGRARPSDAAYTALACTLTSTPAVGATVTIGAVTGLFVEVLTGGCILAGVTGTIPASTTMTVSAVSVGTSAASVTYPTAITPALDALYLADASDVYRALINKPTGSGAIRGVQYYAGSLYCFRDNAGATACVMYKATTSGWTAVAFGEEVSFSNSNTTIADGETLTEGGVTATVRRMVLQTGAIAGGVNTGRLIITGRAGGSFSAGAATASGGAALTLGGAQTAITLTAGGTFQFDIQNFGGQQTTTRMYGCNGLDRCFEFDGTTFVPIATGATTDKPAYIRGHRRYLYVAQGSSVMNSSVGSPTRWVAAEGASEIAVGDTVTGLCSLPGEALGIMSRQSSHALTGASASTWSLQVIRADVGAVARTVVSMSDTYMLDDRGITSVRAAIEYGNFRDATLSRVIQPTIDAIRDSVVCAFASRQRNQYVLLCDDGTAVVMTASGSSGVRGFTTLQYDFVPNSVCSSEDSTGVERVWVGAADGYVYEINQGSSFDGGAVEAFIKVWFNHSHSPRVRKKYRLAVLELSVTSYSAFSFLADFSYGDPDISSHATVDFTALGTGGTWDVSLWDSFLWDSQDIAQPRIAIEGTGLNMSMFFYSNTRIDPGHVLQGATVHYTPRRIQR